MGRRVQVDVVQSRSLVSPHGVDDALTYRCLRALVENVRHLKSEMNPKANKAVENFQETNIGAGDLSGEVEGPQGERGPRGRKGEDGEDGSPYDHSFKFTATSTTGGDITEGYCFIGGAAKTITNLPSSVSSITSSVKYYIEIDLAAATAEWKSTSSAYPVSDIDTEIWPILELTAADSVISAVLERYTSDIHVTLAA